MPHHLIDVAEPDEEWSVARFQQEARAAVADIEARGKRALLVGGTGLYVQAVIDPLTFPPEDRARARERDPGRRDGDDAYAELRGSIPTPRPRIEPGNRRRIVRALEVIEITGRPFSSFGPGLQTYGDTVFPVRVAGVWLPRAARPAHRGRVEAMLDAGLVDEVRGLRRGRAVAPPPRRSGTARCSPTSRGGASLDAAPEAIASAPGSSPAASGCGSGATPASTGSSNTN